MTVLSVLSDDYEQTGNHVEKGTRVMLPKFVLVFNYTKPKVHKLCSYGCTMFQAQTLL